MSIKEKSIKGFFWLSSAKIFSQLILWFFSTFTARLLNPEDYGRMALSLFFILLFSFINELGLGSAIVQWKNFTLEELHSCFWFMFFMNIGMYLLAFFAAYPIGSFFQDRTLIPIIQILALTFILNAIRAVPYSLLRRELEFKVVAKCQLVPSLLSAPLVFVCAFSGFGVWSLIIGYMFQNILFVFLIFYYFPWKPQLWFSFKKIKGMLRFGVSVNTAKFLTFLSGQSDTLIIGKILGAESLGFYNVAFMIGIVPIEKISEIIYHISFSTFSQLQDNQAKLMTYFKKANRYIALTTFPAIAGIFLVADSLIPIVLGEKWAPIVVPLKILCGVGILRAVAVTMIPLLHARGKADSVLKYSLISGIVMPLAFLIGTRFGIMGVAVAWGIVYPFLVAYLVFLCLRELNLSLYEYVRNVTPAITSTLFMVLLIGLFQSTIFRGNIYIHLVGSVMVGILSFSGFLYFTNREFVIEFKNIVHILRQKQA